MLRQLLVWIMISFFIFSTISANQKDGDVHLEIKLDAELKALSISDNDSSSANQLSEDLDPNKDKSGKTNAEETDPLLGNKAYSTFIMVFFGVFGISIGIVSIVSTDRRFFMKIMSYRDITTFMIPIKYHFLFFLTLISLVFYIGLYFAHRGLESPPYFVSIIITMIGSFLYLSLRIIYLLFRP